MKLDVEGATLNIELDGPNGAPPVLLWHGAGCTLRMWDNVVARLSRRYQFIRFDVRGVGQSTPTEDPEHQYTFEQYARDANVLLAHFCVEQCNVWSMAWGSRAAIAYCSLYPQNVLSASFFDASIGPADVAQQKKGAQQAVARQVESGIEPFKKPTGWNVHTNPACVPDALAAAAKFDLTRAVDNLKCPVLVATGDHDPNLESSRLIAEKVPGARLVVLENVGHGSILQRPDLATDTFQAFQDSR